MDYVDELSYWFQTRNIKCAVVGYSGGVDSATTARLLDAAGVHVVLVVAELPNQTYSSPLGGVEGAVKLCKL